MSVTAQNIIDLAIGYLGTKEEPAGSNKVIFNTTYYNTEVSGSAYPWCCAFVWCIFNWAGASELFYGGNKTAYCPALMSYAKANGQWVTSGYQPGDCVLFNWNKTAVAQHIGIVEAVASSGALTTIEGNTSEDSNDNGGNVMRRTRSTAYILGAYRPHFKTKESEDELDMTKDELLSISDTGDKPSAWAAEATEKMKALGIFNGDGNGNFGWQQPITREAVAVVLSNFAVKMGV